MSEFFHLEGEEEIHLVKTALDVWIAKMSATRLVDIDVEDVVSTHQMYLAAKKLAGEMHIGQNPAARPYHTLLIKDGKDDFWEAEFGDFEYEAVMAEANGRESDEGMYLIITTTEQQSSIDGEIKRLNDEICPF